MSHFHRGLLPRLAAMTLMLGGATPALAEGPPPATIQKPGHRSAQQDISRPLGGGSGSAARDADSGNITRPGY